MNINKKLFVLSTTMLLSLNLVSGFFKVVEQFLFEVDPRLNPQPVHVTPEESKCEPTQNLADTDSAAAVNEETNQIAPEEAQTPTQIDLTKSIIMSNNQGVSGLFEEISVKDTEQNKTLLEKIFFNAQPSILHSLIFHGFEKNFFKVADFIWAIEQYSNLSVDEKKSEQTPLKLLLNSNHKNASDILFKMLDAVEIQKVVTLSNHGLYNTGISMVTSLTSYIANPASKDERWNILVFIIENGYFDVLTMLVDKFPNTIKELLEKKSVSRSELNNNNTYESKEYTVLEWLMRKDERYIQSSRKASAKNNYYAQAAKIFAKKNLTLGAEKVKNASWNRLISILYVQQDINLQEHNEYFSN